MKERELDFERDLKRLYILEHYQSKHFKSSIPNRNYKSVDDNSC